MSGASGRGCLQRNKARCTQPMPPRRAICCLKGLRQKKDMNQGLAVVEWRGTQSGFSDVSARTQGRILPSQSQRSRAAGRTVQRRGGQGVLASDRRRLSRPRSALSGEVGRFVCAAPRQQRHHIFTGLWPWGPLGICSTNSPLPRYMTMAWRGRLLKRIQTSDGSCVDIVVREDGAFQFYKRTPCEADGRIEERSGIYISARPLRRRPA
jgi:hypothetical protein